MTDQTKDQRMTSDKWQVTSDPCHFNTSKAITTGPTSHVFFLPKDLQLHLPYSYWLMIYDLYLRTYVRQVRHVYVPSVCRAGLVNLLCCQTAWRHTALTRPNKKGRLTSDGRKDRSGLSSEHVVGVNKVWKPLVANTHVQVVRMLKCVMTDWLTEWPTAEKAWVAIRN